MIEYFMPSEIARLVLGYLKAVNCKNTVSAFLQECIHIKEYYYCLQNGEEYSTNIGGKSLIEILNEYCIFKSAERENFSPEELQTFNKAQNLLKQMLLKQQSLHHVQNSSINALNNNQHSLLQKKQTRCAVVTAQRQCTVKEKHIATLDKCINTDIISKSPHSCSELGDYNNPQTTPSLVKDSSEYQQTCKTNLHSMTLHSPLVNEFSLVNSNNCKNDTRTWKDTASSPIELGNFLIKSTPIKLSSECAHSYSLSYSLPPKDETPQKNIFSEDSNFRSPRRKSQLPKKKSQVSTPQSVKKRGNLINDYDALDLQNEESLSVILEHVMSNTALHEKIAETINKVVNVPTSAPEQTKEAQPSSTMSSSLSQAEELQDMHVTESLIKDIINKAESDPVFEELLSIFDAGKTESNGSSFDITAPLTPLLTENAELFNKVSQDMMEGIEHESLENDVGKSQTVEMTLTHTQSKSATPVQTTVEQNLCQSSCKQILFEQSKETYSSPSVNEPSAYVEIATSYTPMSSGDVAETSNQQILMLNNFDKHNHKHQPNGNPSNKENSPQPIMNTMENQQQEIQNINQCQIENCNKSEGNALYLICSSQDQKSPTGEMVSSNFTNHETDEHTPTTRNIINNNNVVQSADKTAPCSVNSTEKASILLPSSTPNGEANAVLIPQQIDKPNTVYISSIPQTNMSSPIFVTSTSEAITNMQLLTFPPGSNIFGTTTALTTNSNMMNISPGRYVVINYNNTEQKNIQHLTQRNQTCRRMKAKPVRRSAPKQSQNRIERHAIRCLNFHAEEEKSNTKKGNSISSLQNSKSVSIGQEINCNLDRIPLDQAMHDLINVTVDPEINSHNVEMVSNKILKSTTVVTKHPAKSPLSLELHNKSKTKSPQLKNLVNSIQKICKPVQCKSHVRVLDFGTPEKPITTELSSQTNFSKSPHHTVKKTSSTKRKIISPGKHEPQTKSLLSHKKKLSMNNSKKLRKNEKTEKTRELPITINEKHGSSSQKQSETSKILIQKQLQGNKANSILHTMDVDKFLSHLHYIE